jgi:Lipocalin-like domain
MNRRNVMSLSAFTGLGLAILPTAAISQQRTLKKQLIGTWTFVSSIDTDKAGVKSNRWGQNPIGLFIFAADGRYSLMISRSDLPKFAAANVNQGTPEEYKAVVTGIVVSIGTWSVNETAKSFTANIEAGSFPNFIGTSQERIISSLTTDELKYTNSVTSTGTVVESTWKRAKIS